MPSRRSGFVRVLTVLALAGSLSAGAAVYSSESAHADPPHGQVAPAAPVVAPVAPAPPAAAPTPAVADAARVGEAFADVAERSSRYVVSIQVEATRPPQMGGFQGSPFGGIPFGNQGDDEVQRGGGSGVVISADGNILTNNHVVQNATRIDVLLQDGRRFRGRVVGTDPASDLAVVKIDVTGLEAASFADSDHARVGEWVVAIGSPFGLDYTITAGVLSATGRGGLGANEIEDYLQTDASINPGNSGGPLVNLRGEVLGINTMIIGRGTGIGFAIPSEIARNVANQLVRTGQVRRAWIGVSFQDLTPELASHFGNVTGALVGSVVPGGPAATAGLVAGDVIVSVDGRPVQAGHDLLRTVLRHEPGTAIPIELRRNSRALTLQLTTGVRPTQGVTTNAATPQRERRGHGLGLGVQPLTPDIRRQLGYAGNGSVVVSQVENGSAAERAGLHRGDVILEADRLRVDSREKLAAALSDGRALLLVERQGGTMFVALGE